jgi:phage tail sheath protein FI
MPAPIFLTNGTDGPALTLGDFLGDPNAMPNQRRALLALEDVDEIAILCCPDEHAFGPITDALVEQCERLKDRFAILQAGQAAVAIANLRPPTTSKYGGFYYPWLRVPDRSTGMPVEVPPGGHVAGIYARSDIERGVHKAPANEVIRGLFVDPVDPASGLLVQINKGQQDILNPRGVNVLRNFPGRGNLVWGARTTTLDPDWKYVNVRRLFIFVEESIEEATQWVVFEPNDEPLWARVRRSVGDFLTRLWMDGMLQGRTKEEAYFVKCDRTTMTQADIDNGKLIMLIGIAPVKPAEFVIFRIGQWTGGSDITEG